MFVAIRDQKHEMWAEGTADNEIAESDVSKAIKEYGFDSSNIDIYYDELFECWGFTADIKKFEGETNETLS